jgi:hypothetical protein|nr:hypothetical protein [Kofleriaceae bacterium]
MSRQTFGITATAVAAAVIAACSSWIAGVPKAMQGDNSIVVVNWTDSDVCTFGMTPAGQPVDHDADWLGKLGRIHPGEVRVYSVKPGDYTMSMHGCGDKFGAEQPLHVERPTAIAIGQPQHAPPPGYAVVRAHTTGTYGRYVRPADVAPAGGGEQPAAAEGGDEQPAEGGGGDEPASTESTPAKPEEPSGGNRDPNCRPSGATCDQSYQCCSEACVTHSPDDYCR